VEDLFDLLVDVKTKLDFDAICSGAILSDYQRIRVENV
jgi:diphthine-ammonia ligase